MTSRAGHDNCCYHVNEHGDRATDIEKRTGNAWADRPAYADRGRDGGTCRPSRSSLAVSTMADGISCGPAEHLEAIAKGLRLEAAIC